MKKILVMGGNRFVGKKLVQNLLDGGDEITVANRSGTSVFQKDVRCISFNRNEADSIKNKIGIHSYDVIYDMICYSPKNAEDVINYISAGKYMMISSSVVYDWGLNHKEEEFDASKFEVIPGTIEELGQRFGYKQGYKIGKMGAEAVITKNGKIPSLCVRFPLIVGSGDHTGRLKTYVDHIGKGEAIWIDNLFSQVSVVHVEHAAAYLAGLKDKSEKLEGAVNIADSGHLQIRELVEKISKILKRDVFYSAGGEKGGYNEYFSNTFHLGKMMGCGLKPQHVDEYMDSLIAEEISNYLY